MEHPYGPPSNTHDNYAIWSLVCGIVGIVCCGFAGIAAIFLGFMSISAENRAPYIEKSGRTMAIVGIVLGGLSCLMLVLGIIMMVLQWGMFGPGSPWRVPGRPPFSLF